MGSGKSTLGPILANVLGYRFADLDARVAESAGRPVTQVFAEEGEAAFRAREAEALRATGREHRLVVATGGGALTREPNLSWALAHGTVAYLRASPDALVARLQRSRNVRPLLLDADGTRLTDAALRARIQALLEARRPFYEQAHVVVDVGAGPVGPAVDVLARAVRQLWARGASGGADAA